MFAFIKAKIWSGAGWLLTLCLVLVLVSAIYLILHSCNKGSDHKKLDNIQLLNIDNILAGYSDTDLLASKDPAAKKVILNLWVQRDQALSNFLTSEYNGQVNEAWLKQVNTLLINLNNKDAKTYLNGKEIIVNSFFWFVGPGTYAEVLFWALIGVLTSLIYYVSNANGIKIKQTDETDSDTADTAGTGPFNTAEIPGQVSKLFYAPVSALVLVFGYNLLGDSTTKMTDITMGNGLLLFSFISGFFSGRVMKFLDKLKDLILPLGSSANTTTTSADVTEPAANEKVADVTVELQLVPALSSTTEGADIVDLGFNSAVVTLKPEAGELITLTKPADDQSSGFTATQVPLGKYTLQATMASKIGNAVTNLSASTDVEVSETNKTFQLEMDKTADVG
ncbi:hypothetical protein SNE25_18690 [Mucilaginibacter sabulilitoris]|uniref:Uncharacterized protein n=1 Tax=Mucilaginibacter sabulilitoris TaxID=1173583 RepID=A0ABZ0TDQ9_9SPHI|nr:hypothetical protein [Mucilaginibacter sabulilitoris]WPU91349.1 hypothetical protein SNE25_18690 [Mucilaginibacter sabulilitoris]